MHVSSDRDLVEVRAGTMYYQLDEYFSYKGISGGLANFPVKCASCYFNTQWGGSNVNSPTSPDTLLTNNNYIKCQ